MLEVLDDFLISKDEEAVASVLILLTVEFSADNFLDSFNFPLVIGLFVLLDAAAPAPDTSANTDLPSNGSFFLVFVFNKLQLVEQLLQLNTLFVQVVVVADDSGTDKDTLACDGVGWVQLDHVGRDTTLQGLYAFINWQVAHFNGEAGDVDVFEFLHRCDSLLPSIVLLSEDKDHVERQNWNDHDCANVSEDHLRLFSSYIQHSSGIHFRHIIVFPIVRGHWITCHVQRHDDDSVEDSDDEE